MSTVPPSRDDQPFLRIGKYEVLAHIATGGMGVVYKALDRDLGREVAIKLLSPGLASKPDKLERFRSEARHAARLRHKNIVNVYDFGEADGTFFLVLEYIDGIDLLEHIHRKGQLDAVESCKILIQAVRALVHLHELGMVHRDIKPANFLLARQNNRTTLKLTDLGLAREVDDDEFKVTREGTTVGTVDYMAPEQARNSRAADIRSDIYSLGCSWYHMLAGRPPFAEGGMVERLYKHLEEEPPDIREFNPLVPDSILPVLGRMLAKKPENRYQTPAELLADLENLKRNKDTIPKETVRPRSERKKKLRPLRLPSEPLETPVPPEPPPEAPAEDLSSSTQNILAVDQASSQVPAPNPEQKRAAAGQYERALEVLVEGNHDYAIHLLLSCCRLDPANLGYRQALRRTQKAKYRNLRGSRFAWLTTLAARTRLKSALRAHQYLKVLEHGEEVLSQNPWELGTQMDMAEAANTLGLLALAIWTLEEARDRDSDNVNLNRALARLFEKRGSYKHAIALWEKVRKIDPTDTEAAQKITDLAANETIARINRQ